MPIQASGSTIKPPIRIGLMNCFESKYKTEFTEAPKTLRMLISFRRWSVANDAKPHRPKQPISTANIENALNNFPIFSSSLYCELYASSKK